jgi:hypothetical protein
MNKRIMDVLKRFSKRSRTEAKASLGSPDCWPVQELLEDDARQFEAE